MIPLTNRFDLVVLRCLSEAGACGVAAVARQFDRSRSYVRSRLVTLAATGYVRAVGLEPRSHIYELTSKGAAVARRADDVIDA